MTFLAQKVQDEHDKRHLQVAEQTASDHFIKELHGQEYWKSFSYQELNNNSLLAESIRFIKRLKEGEIDIIECGIEIGYLERMYYAEFGMFNIPPVEDETLKRLHGMTFGIPRIDYDVYKCTPTPGQLFTNKCCDAPDLVLSPEGEGGAKWTMM